MTDEVGDATDEPGDVADGRADVTDGHHRDEGGRAHQPLESNLVARPDETAREADVLGAGDTEGTGAAADEPAVADDPAAADGPAVTAEPTLFDELAATGESTPPDAVDEPAPPDAQTDPDAPGPDETAVSDAAATGDEPVPDEKVPDAAAVSDAAATGSEAGLLGEPPASDEAMADDARVSVSTAPDASGEPPASEWFAAEDESGVAGTSSSSDELTTEDVSAPWTRAPVMGDAPAAFPGEPSAGDRQDDAPQGPAPIAEVEGVRSVDGELARLHLRTGMLALARAELETMAGWSALDREALIDLAEVRWRTGDLVGAGEAAAAYLEVGGDEPIAFCVAAEAALAGGRRADAEAYAARALDLAASRLDELFAGQPRSNLWPAPLARTAPSAAGTPIASARSTSWLAAPVADEIATPAIPGPASPATTDTGWVGSAATAEPAAAEPATTDAATTEDELAVGPSADAPPGPFAAGMPVSGAGMPPAAGASSPAGPPPQAGVRSIAGGWSPAGLPPTAGPTHAGPAASDELAEAERRLASGELLGFALRLQVVLRLQPALAPAVLALADAALQAHAPSSDEAAAIHLVRSDACRLIGREVLSGAAMQEARRLLHAPTAAEDSL